jgi:DeoR family transcriptional regulator, aga operon transcriptional repressor
MARRLYRRERLSEIVKQLQQTGYVSVAELSEDFGVSAVTVRADLDALEEAGQLLRTHGGAVPITRGEDALSFSVRQRLYAPAKDRIGAAAAELVADGQAVILDASTTAWHMARHLLARREVTVLTTGLYVALELLRSPSITVMVPGGVVWREAAAACGPWDRSLVEEGHFQRAFFGGRGLNLVDGLTDAHQDEAALKRQLAKHVRELNVILDATKIAKMAFATLATVEQIDRVITSAADPGPSAEGQQVLDGLRDRGVEIVAV